MFESVGWLDLHLVANRLKCFTGIYLSNYSSDLRHNRSLKSMTKVGVDFESGGWGFDSLWGRSVLNLWQDSFKVTM